MYKTKHYVMRQDNSNVHCCLYCEHTQTNTNSLIKLIYF